MIYRFGEFELRPERYELLRSGEAVALEPRVLEVLAYLVAHRDRTISKQELLDALWEEEFVTEAALTRTIRELRKALGDAASDSPFDRYLRGDQTALGPAARRGMELFYGEAGCASCHSGKFQTDHDFHAIAMPQIGPGKSDGWNPDYWRATGLRAFPEDFGRGRETVREEDRYKFRTPSLRNVALTGPWGHAGAYDTLEAVVRHHLSPVESLELYAARLEALPPVGRVLELAASGSRLEQTWLSDSRQAGFIERDTWVARHAELRAQIAAANELAPIELTASQVADLLAFLESLTDPRAAELVDLVPERVPSGLPVAD